MLTFLESGVVKKNIINQPKIIDLHWSNGGPV
jgi:hypothetical protein